MIINTVVGLHFDPSSNPSNIVDKVQSSTSRSKKGEFNIIFLAQFLLFISIHQGLGR